MSHKASYWLATLRPDGISNGAFRVLFHLCDAHNDKRDPATACFPSQERLRDVTGLSNSGLNKVLNALEEDGFLRRRRTRAPDGKQGPTYYILGCDELMTQPTPLSGVGEKREQSQAELQNQPVDNPVDNPVENTAADSTLRGQPTPLFGVSRLHHGGVEPVIEPKIEPSGARTEISRLETVAGLIKTGKSFLCTNISAHAARSCIRAGLISPSECDGVGIRI